MSGVWAALITLPGILGSLVTVNSHSSWWLIRTVAFLPSIPGGLIVGYVGLGHGPDGLPTERDAVLYVFTFLLWWAIVALIRSVRRLTTDV